MNRLKLATPMWNRAFGAAAIVLLCLSVARPAAAQIVTSADIQRLQDQVYDASNDVSRMTGNPDTAARLRTELDDLRDEVVYLKVKLRKEGSVSRSDFNDVQDRIQSVRSRVRTEANSSNSGGWHTNGDAEGARLAVVSTTIGTELVRAPARGPRPVRARSRPDRKSTCGLKTNCHRRPLRSSSDSRRPRSLTCTVAKRS